MTKQKKLLNYNERNYAYGRELIEIKSVRKNYNIEHFTMDKKWQPLLQEENRHRRKIQKKLWKHIHQAVY